jgi:hypothetical protein
MHYWAVAIFRESFEAQRFDNEREAMAFAQVHARLPDAELVAVDACAAIGARPYGFEDFPTQYIFNFKSPAPKRSLLARKSFMSREGSKEFLTFRGEGRCLKPPTSRRLWKNVEGSGRKGVRKVSPRREAIHPRRLGIHGLAGWLLGMAVRWATSARCGPTSAQYGRAK